MKTGHKEYRIFSNLKIKNESEYEDKLEIWKKDKIYTRKKNRSLCFSSKYRKGYK